MLSTEGRMIGLKRDTVVVVPFQQTWADLYKNAELELLRLLKQEIQFVEHVGSTAIKEIVSKPIIDIAVAIESYDKLDRIRRILLQNEFEDRGKKVGGYLFLKRRGDLTTHHIHFVIGSGKKWRDYIFFKNKLNADFKLREQYSKLKQNLAKKYANNRGDYTKAKNEFISQVLLSGKHLQFMKDKKLEIGVIGGSEKRDIQIVEYDKRWVAKFQKHAKIIKDALGNVALEVEHIGSTAVPNLAAKPIIDMLLEVSDSGDESKYLKELQTAGYQLRVREPDFREHRMFRTTQKDVHIHVLSKGSSEIDRYLAFRNRLKLNETDRKAYETIKRKLAASGWEDMNEYANAKTQIIERIIAAGFDSLG
ncbi:MAG: GrpB family protein [Bacteroidota bacterium]